MRKVIGPLLLTTLTLAPSAAAWTRVGAMPAPERDGAALVFRSDQGAVSVTALAPDVVRVRFAPAPGFGRDHSYAVTSPGWEEPDVTVDAGDGRTVLKTAELVVTIRHDPFRIAFADAEGRSLDEDDELRGTAYVGEAVKVWKRLRDDEHVYGFGEKTGRLDKRGWKLGGISTTMWNSDTFAYDASTDPLYASVPFFLVLREGRAHGIFLDNTYRSHFDVGRETQGVLSFGASGGELNYYFFAGPTPKDVVSRYTELTGRAPLPPRWALGFHQCRYSYYPESRVRFIAENLRQRRIPADAIWLDIHYQDGYKPFTWDPERFPDPGRLIADLREQGLRTVVIVDPHPKAEKGYAPYDEGMAGGHFVTDPAGEVIEVPVWPSQAERDPGPSVFADFSRPATREWWGGLYTHFLDLGVAGIWNDMDEPAVFNTTGTLPLDARHDNEGQPSDHREIHNVYGMLMTRATYEGLLRLRPEERPFVLTRATFAGGQRWAAAWPGDNRSYWEDLRGSIPQLLGMGISGLGFVGVDVGGFAGTPSAELFTRWLQAAIFYPFLRAHTAFGTADQEPWSYGTRHEEVNRQAIELRYRLLPEIYKVMREMETTGIPAMRPLFLEYPEDPQTWGLDNEFLFGTDLLIAPVLEEGATARGVYLPAGDWYEFATGEPHRGGDWIRKKVTLETIPVYVRGGAFLFQQGVVQHTGEMTGQPLLVDVYPAPRSETTFYEDEGQGFAYREGVYRERAFRQRREEGRITVEAGAVEGTYRPQPRDIVFRIRVGSEPRRVLVYGSESRDWNWDDGVVTVRLEDSPDNLRVVVEL